MKVTDPAWLDRTLPKLARELIKLEAPLTWETSEETADRIGAVLQAIAMTPGIVIHAR